MPTSSSYSASMPLDDVKEKDSTSKRFRFKKTRERDGMETSKDDSRRKHREHKRRRHHSKRRKHSPHAMDDPAARNGHSSDLPPDVAFRESLFDALGDDEGAAFWESVYGQPIHMFSNTRQHPGTGELEQMNDEEYAQHVRRKMWEKSWEGIEAAKEEKRRIREAEKKQRHKEGQDNEPRQQSSASRFDPAFDFEIAASLRRGEVRKARKYWKDLWESYLSKWTELATLRQECTSKGIDPKQLVLRDQIAWPVESGELKDVSPEKIERFVNKCAASVAIDEDSSEVLASILKQERVRWHPDKILQKYGDTDIEPNTMKMVTAVFQVIDRMWTEVRSSKS